MVRAPWLWASLLAAVAGACLSAESRAASTAPAPVSAGQTAAAPAPSERALGRLAEEARSAGLDPAVLDGPLGEARRALRRAAGARAAGDSTHAAMLDRLAAEWAEVARTLVRAARVERAAQAAAERGRDLGVRLERTRALIVEQQAHRWRLQAELERRRDRPAPAAATAPAAAPAPATARPAVEQPARKSSEIQR